MRLILAGIISIEATNNKKSASMRIETMSLKVKL
jgi:hypothetical protein